MIVNGREIIFKERLYNEMAQIDAYIGQTHSEKGRKWISELVDFLLTIVSPNPFMYISWQDRTTATLYRRAIFKRNYAILYEVTDAKIDFVTIYHTSQNPDAIDLGDPL